MGGSLFIDGGSLGRPKAKRNAVLPTTISVRTVQRLNAPHTPAFAPAPPRRSTRWRKKTPALPPPGKSLSNPYEAAREDQRNAYSDKAMGLGQNHTIHADPPPDTREHDTMLLRAHDEALKEHWARMSEARWRRARP